MYPIKYRKAGYSTTIIVALKVYFYEQIVANELLSLALQLTVSKSVPKATRENLSAMKTKELLRDLKPVWP